jgi:ABC-type lipoprotein export system ATPase subunit
MHLLSIQGLHKVFNHTDSMTNLFHQWNFEVCIGETVAITGESGTGKSTLLQIIQGFDTQYQGHILWQGNSMGQWSEKQWSVFRNRLSGRLFQKFHLFGEWTALENVLLPTTMHPKNPIYKAKATSLLEQVGLGSKIHHYPKQLSGGEQQRVAFCRSIVMDPQLLLCDEPTGNLDQANTDILWQILKEYQTTHQVAIVIVTHDKKLAAACDKEFTLYKNRVL